VSARAILALVAVLLAGTEGRAQTISVVNPTIPVSPRANTISLIVKVGSIDPASLKPEGVSFTDLYQPESIAIKQDGSAIPLGAIGQKSYWLLKGSINGRLSDAKDSHFLKVTAGKVVEVVNVSVYRSDDLRISIKDPPFPLRLTSSRRTEIQLTSSGTLSHVKLGQIKLAEDKTGNAFPESALILLDDSGKPVDPARGLTLGEPIQSVRVAVTCESIPAGKFSGTVGLTSLEKPDLGSFKLMIFSSSPLSRVEGLALLLAGIVTYFVIAVALKARSRWLMALLPAARLRSSIAELFKLVKGIQQTTGYAFPTLLDTSGNPCSLKALSESLEVDELKKAQYLPYKFALPFGTQDVSMQYQAFLSTKASQVSFLQTIVRWGLGTVSRLWPEIVKSGVQPAGDQALHDLDALACFSGPPGLLTTQVQGILNTLQNAISAAGPRPGGAPIDGVEIYGFEQVMVQLERLSWFVWIVWALLTLVVGYSALIGFNDGFGTRQDLLQCFLWGAGIPAIGQGLGSLTSGAVTSAFSVQIPR
jgi:hypothetical protein